LAGRSKHRPELAKTPLPLEARVAALPCSGGTELLERLFPPLGYRITAQRVVLDEKFPEWGESRYYTVTLSGEKLLQEMLAHLYVLIPVLDDEKHYWVGDDEVGKLLRRGEGWLAAHPERELITRRYLKHQFRLTRTALARLAEEDQPDPDEALAQREAEEEGIEERINLNQQRLGAVLAALRQSGARRVLDLGCGEGRLLTGLLADRSFTEIVGVDVSHRSLGRAAERLHLDRLPPMQKERIRLLQGSLTYRDKRLNGYEAAAVVEVVEHLDAPRLAAFERILFEQARPGVVVVTTPNREYNVRFETLPAGQFRHRDHRFEWTRAEFQAWARYVSERFGYAPRFLPVGTEDPEVGPPTQMAIFKLKEKSVG
jgi:3' terminal RNA ribose 2'-O-methyltransferase Hen1